MYFRSGTSVAARPKDARTIQRTASAVESNTAARTKRSPLPRKIREIAWEINRGWRVRRNKRSTLETGRVSRYSMKPNPSSTHAAAPKHQRHNTSANGSAGRRKTVRKPSRVGDQVAIVIRITQGGYQLSALSSLLSGLTLRGRLIPVEREMPKKGRSSRRKDKSET